MTTKRGLSDPSEGSNDDLSVVAARGHELDAAEGTRLFGSPIRSDVLVLIAGLERTYPRELARLMDRPISMIQKIVADLERSGVVVSRLIGNVREVSLNPDFFVAKELKNLLTALLEREPRYGTRLLDVARRRPRRSGKPL